MPKFKDKSKSGKYLYYVQHIKGEKNPEKTRTAQWKKRQKIKQAVQFIEKENLSS